MQFQWLSFSFHHHHLILHLIITFNYTCPVGFFSFVTTTPNSLFSTTMSNVTSLQLFQYTLCKFHFDQMMPS